MLVPTLKLLQKIPGPGGQGPVICVVTTIVIQHLNFKDYPPTHLEGPLAKGTTFSEKGNK